MIGVCGTELNRQIVELLIHLEHDMIARLCVDDRVTLSPEDDHGVLVCDFVHGDDGVVDPMMYVGHIYISYTMRICILDIHIVVVIRCRWYRSCC